MCPCWAQFSLSARLPGPAASPASHSPGSQREPPIPTAARCPQSHQHLLRPPRRSTLPGFQPGLPRSLPPCAQSLSPHSPGGLVKCPSGRVTSLPSTASDSRRTHGKCQSSHTCYTHSLHHVGPDACPAISPASFQSSEAPGAC